MSDESSPPLLRLKPRAKVEPEGIAVPQPVAVMPAPAEPPTADLEESGAGPRLRLKPKLAGSADAGVSIQTPQPAAVKPQPAAELPKPVISLRPPLPPANAPALAPTATSTEVPADAPAQAPVVSSVPAVSEPAATKPKFSLQREPAITSTASPSDIPTRIASKPPLPPFPVVAPAAPTPPPLPEETQPASVVPHLRAPQRMLGEQAFSPPPPPKAERKTVSKPVLGAAVVTVLIVGGFVGFRYFKPAKTRVASPAAVVTTPAVAAAPTKAASKPESSTPTSTPAVVAASTAAPTPAPVTTTKPGPTPSETLNTLAAAPARAIAKAQAVVDAQRVRQQDRIEVYADGEKSAPVRPTPTTPAGVDHKAAAPTALAVHPQVAPTMTATANATSATGVTSAEFRAWAAAARVSGIFKGATPRALINGRMVQAGQTVDEALAITFDRLEPDGKTLIFRDASGTTIARRF